MESFDYRKNRKIIYKCSIQQDLKFLTLIAFNGQHFFDDNNMHKNTMMSSTLLSNLHE